MMRSRMLWCIVGMVLGAGLPGVASAASDVEILLNKLVEKGILTPADAGQIHQEMVQQRATEKPALAGEVVPQWAQRVTLSGDLRLRQESFWRDSSSANARTRSRQRMRLRVGAKANVSDQVEAGVRFATGTNLDPTSTNQSVQDVFDKKDLFVDLAYLKLSTAGLDQFESVPLTLWGGKFETPWSYTPLVWDSDLTPEGVALSLAPAMGPVTLSTTGGVFPIDELAANGEDPALWLAQAGVSWPVAPEAAEEWLKHLTVKGAMTYYDYMHLDQGIDTTASNRFGNTVQTASSAGTTLFQFDYDEWDLMGEIHSRLFGQPVKLYADYVKNTAVADDDEGFLVGVQIGRADTPWAWEGGYYYKRLEPDAVVGQFTDSDFGDGGADRSGHLYYAAIGTLKHSTLGAKLYVTEGLSTPETSIDRLQVDWATKF